MFGKIKYISDNIAHVLYEEGNMEHDLMNVHVIFEAPQQKILGEVTEINPEYLKIRFLGEFVNGKYVNGVMRKPLLSSSIRMIRPEELTELVGSESDGSFLLGKSAIYSNSNIVPSINDFFSNHFAIFGNTGSGKSCGVARMIQNIFQNQSMLAYHANLVLFDSFGEYKNAFRTISKFGSHYNYKFITTHPVDDEDVLLQIPVNLLKIDDWALLLQANTHSQLPIIERTLRLAKIFSQKNEEAEEYKNHLIAKALLAVLFSNQTTAHKKNEIFTIIEVCNTTDFNFDARISGLGYSRSFSECFEIDSNGYFGESVLITDYILRHVNDDLEDMKEPKEYSFSILDFSKALEFTLISEGFQNNSKVYDDAIILKVRLSSILNTKISNYFVNVGYVRVGDFVQNLIMNRRQKAQIININLEDVDDIYAKVFVKILCRILFDFSKSLLDRASMPMHLILEEAHRYIQKDLDTFLLGYNIFDRIAKEGRKYGTILGVISQRPVEISDTVIAQMSNFLIFKMTHPKDIKYIEEMLPNISEDIISKQKVLQPGSCVAFGSAFKIPMIVKLDLPDPLPYSSNCNVARVWNAYKNESNQLKQEQNGESELK